MASRLMVERNPLGTWNGDVVRRELFPVPETSGSALIVFMLATGVAEGWLDQSTYGPVAAKAFHALTLLVDRDGDVHHIERSVETPSAGEYLASDAADINLNYGPGAFLMASAAMARLGAWLAVMETTESVVLERSRLTVDGQRLVINIGELGLDIEGAETVVAVSAQVFLDARIEGDTLSVEDRGEGPVAVFARWPVNPVRHSPEVSLVAQADRRWPGDRVVCDRSNLQPLAPERAR